MSEFHADHPHCWMCMFLGVKQTTKTELHHIAGRGKKHDVRENYAALCSRHHETLQSRRDAELICLALKNVFDREHYSPETVCVLRGKAKTCWTDLDVATCHRVMMITKESCK
jgi:hypothetical protein